MGNDQIRQYIRRFRGFFASLAGIPPSISPANQCFVYYDADRQSLLKSENGGAYRPIGAESEQLLSATDVYVDPATGDDANSGLSPATALATIDEYVERIGTGVVAAQQTLHILSDVVLGPVGAFFRGTYEFQLIVQGSRTVVRSGTITGVQAWNGTTFTDGQITDAVVATWVPNVGQMLVLTSGANAGAVAWVAADVGGGSDTCRHSQFFDLVTFSAVNPAIGDDYDVVTLTSITGNTVAATTGYTAWQDIAFVDAGFFGALRLVSGQNSLQGCLIDSNFGESVEAGCSTYTAIAACRITGSNSRMQIRSPFTFLQQTLLEKPLEVYACAMLDISQCVWEGSQGMLQMLVGANVQTRQYAACYNAQASNLINMRLQSSFEQSSASGTVFGAGNDAAGTIALWMDSASIFGWAGATMAASFGITGAVLTEIDLAGDATLTYATVPATGTSGLNTERLAGIVPKG